MRENLEIEVKKNRDNLISELMPHRNSKVEKDIDFPTSYRARTYASNSDPTYAFNKAFSDSEFEMIPRLTLDQEPRSGEEVRKIMEHTSQSEAKTNLEALVKNQYEHIPILEKGMDALRNAGYETKVEIESSFIESTIRDTLEGFERQGANVELIIKDGPQGEDKLTSDLYTNISYHPDHTFEPQVSVCEPKKTDRNEAEEVNSALEDILKQDDLLK